MSTARTLATAALLSIAVEGCRSAVRETAADARLVDPHATAETKALFLNLQRLSRDHVLFGHQDDLAYGVEWTHAPERSDVKDVTGSFPAVYGWDASGIERDSPKNIDGVQFSRMREWIRGGYRRGGVITLSWHMNNPASGGNAWDTTAAVSAILPGGSRISVPTGYAEFPREILKPPRSAASLVFSDIRRWSVMKKGGHFAALEEPDLLIDDVRAFFREVR